MSKAPKQARRQAVARRLQSVLARLNDAHVSTDVSDFLLTDREQARRCSDADGAPIADEQVLVRLSQGELQISVYIDAQVLDRLEAHDPERQLDECNLQDFCTALEGISHFQYLIWSAQRGREVSLLELELQAEVDKYASAMRLLLEQSRGRFPRDLHSRLFHRVSYAPELEDEHRRRYREANRQAAYFCRTLDQRFLDRRRAQPEAWLASLRQFFRLGHPVKMRSVFT
jgi:hypothetical protein